MKGTNSVKAMTNRRVAGVSLGLLILTSGQATVWAQATRTPFEGIESHVAWLVQPPPETTPSGNTKIRGWVHLWYDDADDDRLDGYDTVTIWATINKNGDMVTGGTFTVREKLDAIPIDDLLSGAFDPNDIVQGAVLWEGTWTWNPREQPAITAVAHSRGGLTAFYTFAAGTITGYILDPHEK